ncbi:MAG: hypothetical protein JNM70_15880 [Anaerolineae bacterium]|nr:hypothetical protein [Anaerolineae bacterium]
MVGAKMWRQERTDGGYAGCDADTTAFYNKASGTATTDANIADPNTTLRQCPPLTVDEIITPQAGFATQVVLNAWLTRFQLLPADRLARSCSGHTIVAAAAGTGQRPAARYSLIHR